MRQKLITLDPTSWDRAQKKDNFSEWVRKQLQLEVDGRSIGALETELDEAYRRSDGWYKRYTKLVRDRKVKE